MLKTDILPELRPQAQTWSQNHHRPQMPYMSHTGIWTHKHTARHRGPHTRMYTHTPRHIHTHVYTTDMHTWAQRILHSFSKKFWAPAMWFQLVPQQDTHHIKKADSSYQSAHSGHLQNHGSTDLPGNAWASGIEEPSRKRANRDLQSLTNRAAQLNGGLEHQLKGTQNILVATHGSRHVPIQIVLLHVVEKRIGTPLWGGKLDPGSKLTAFYRAKPSPKVFCCITCGSQ